MWSILPTTTQLQRKSGFSKYFHPAAAPIVNLANNNVLAWIRFPLDKRNRAMLSTEQINDLHRLYWSERWPIRKIERHLRMGWHTIRKYLDAPAQGPSQRPRTSKLDAFKATIAEWLEKDATLTGAVIQQRLRPLGYTGGPTILCDYLQKVRPQAKRSRAFVRMEPSPGERFEVDWGHFGVLDYAGDKRKLYAFALVEAHSRMLYLEFTHSQSFETFVRCHMHAFIALGGVAREVAYDNLATAVAEHDGRLVRFSTAFSRFCSRVWLISACLQFGSGLGKRQSGAGHRVYASELLAGPRVHRSA
jgi:transposase